MTAPLLRVSCSSARRSNYGVHVCGELIDEVPEAWGPVHVHKLTDYGARTGGGRVVRCRKCKTWMEITYGGLALRSA